MKKLLISLVAILISVVANSQIITIEVFETQPYVKWIKTGSQDVLTSPEWVGYKESVNAVYIFDIDAKTCKFYVNGNLIVDELVKNIIIDGDNIKIQSTEPSLENPAAVFETEFDVNLKTKESSLTWFNSYGDYTRAQKNTKTNITVTSKMPL
jgi:hypothetical protein